MFIEPGPGFAELFERFKYTAYRLETRDVYRAANEETAFAQFVAGQSVDMTWFQEWLELIERSTAEGRIFSRVRVVSVPLTDYSRFGLMCSGVSNHAGEVTRYLARARAAEIPDYDYWLFDSTKLVRMHFDSAENFLGAEVIEDPVEVIKHNYWRDAAWHVAIERSEFARATSPQQRDGSP